MSSRQSRDIWFPKARIYVRRRKKDWCWPLVAVVGDVGEGGLMTHGNDIHVTFGVLPLPLFPSTLLLLPSLMAPVSLSGSDLPHMLHRRSPNFGLSVLLNFYFNMI